MHDQNPYCEMMLGWAGYTIEQIAERKQKGMVCGCDAHAGGICKWTGKAYFAKPPESRVKDSPPR